MLIEFDIGFTLEALNDTAVSIYPFMGLFPCPAYHWSFFFSITGTSFRKTSKLLVERSINTK